jgi:NTE family protein
MPLRSDLYGPGVLRRYYFLYLAEVKFEDLEDPAKRSYMDKLPTSFRLKPEEVDKLRDAARRLLRKSESFEKLLRDLEK